MEPAPQRLCKHRKQGRAGRNGEREVASVPSSVSRPLAGQAVPLVYQPPDLPGPASSTSQEGVCGQAGPAACQIELTQVAVVSRQLS